MTQIVAKKKIRYPMALERQYSKEIVSCVNDMFDIIKSRIPAMVRLIKQHNLRSDADDDNEALDDFMEKLAALLLLARKSRKYVTDMYKKVKLHNEAQFKAVTKSVFGRPLAFKDVDTAVKQQRILSQIENMWVRENLDLISSIEAETLRKLRWELSQRIVATAGDASLQTALTDYIENQARIERNRAVLIASDQVGKLNGRLMRYEQQRAGITHYRWETMQDSRVRPTHRERQGQIFSWDEPPSDGHPGEAVRCRCVADPVFDTAEIGVEPEANTYAYVA